MTKYMLKHTRNKLTILSLSKRRGCEEGTRGISLGCNFPMGAQKVTKRCLSWPQTLIRSRFQLNIVKKLSLKGFLNMALSKNGH